MNRRLPLLAWLLGLAGLIPFAACGVLAVAPDGDRAGFALVAYGAVVLAFLGGVHWGFALEDPARRGERGRLSLGVLPSLAGWVALLLAVAVNVVSGLGLLIVGFAATAVIEARAAKAGLMPPGYLKLRYGLTGVVETVLILVALICLAGGHIQL